jgi:hypothetical protein
MAGVGSGSPNRRLAGRRSSIGSPRCSPCGQGRWRRQPRHLRPCTHRTPYCHAGHWRQADPEGPTRERAPRVVAQFGSLMPRGGSCAGRWPRCLTRLALRSPTLPWRSPLPSGSGQGDWHQRISRFRVSRQCLHRMTTGCVGGSCGRRGHDIRIRTEPDIRPTVRLEYARAREGAAPRAAIRPKAPVPTAQRGWRPDAGGFPRYDFVTGVASSSSGT